MDSKPLVTKREKGLAMRKCAISLAVLATFTGLITLGVHLLVDWAITETIKKHAEMSAVKWAEEFNENLPASGDLLAGQSLTAGQQSVIESAMNYGHVYAFIVYNTDGRAVYSSDYGVSSSVADQPVNKTALAVVASKNSSIDVVQKVSPTGSQSVFVDALVPAKDETGTVIGAVQLYLDESEPAAFYTSFLDWIALLLPILCAIIYIVPAFAFILKREQAFARTKWVHHLSRFDTLTGALNRHTMSTECKERFADRATNRKIGVFFMDVDKFKTINDTNGHEFGDAYLKHIASILISSVRDIDLVGRMGGDEFVIAFPDATHELLDTVGERILQEARKPFEYKGKTIQGSISIGSHLADLDEDGPGALHAADLALYHAKTQGRNTLQWYFRELDTAMIRRCAVEARIRDALRDDAFETHFQPLTDAANGSIVGFEALLRLNDADGHPISPAEFVPIAEETCMIQEIGMKALRQAIEAAKSWPEHIFLSVNLSPAQFASGDLVDDVQALLDALDFPAGRLELEVTESLLMADEDRVSAQLHGLKRMGIAIAMDDFGTGYSSLGYLWKYDFDKLKIDRVFLEGFDFDPVRYREIIETIVTLGHKMGMQVTIEGVETELQTDMLKDFACDQYQGFLFGKPMPADQALAAVSVNSLGDTSAA
ncbi:EAL domain-containing protein [Roseobacter sp. YSTF-M11]|uniref:EAL domain-containing protein n=1 Tax=Roseobacter insulae TaxID=2859783 RepID=A0A9X1FXB3_9RHOB|nr:GGDEF domain-containing phosphodiesterase [Roseobacter insulae]MBW4709368.1 EAL domain-containing protein [Roseobacter insulae]